MSTSMSKTMEKIHKVNRILLEEVNRVCMENNIQYFLDSGTLLGAVRHKDIIPWDDDIDLTFTRDNLEKFIKVAPKCLKKEFKLVLPGSIYKDSFFDFIPKIVYLPSKIHKDSEEEAFYGNNLNHIALDLFCIDKVHQNPLMRKIQMGELLLVYGMAMGHRYSLDWKQYQGLSKPVVFLLSRLGKGISIDKLVKWYFTVAGKYNKLDQSNKVFVSNYPVNTLSNVFDKAWFSNSVEGEIGGKRYPMPVGYHELLTEVYNDYMELPPEEERKAKHIREEYIKVNGI